MRDVAFRFLYDASVNILTVTKGAVYICMSSSELDTLQKAFCEAGAELCGILGDEVDQAAW